MTLAVILQPTYLPWIGFFAQIDIADVFVFYDDVQFVYRTFHRRNRIRTPQGWKYLSVPVEKKFGTIAETHINNNVGWKEEHRTTIERCYKKAEYFENHEKLLDDLYGRSWSLLGEMTTTHAKIIANEAGISTEFIKSSDMSIEGRKTERLINVLKKIGADTYLTGPACRTYLDINRFKEEGIDLQWFIFQHPTYSQRFPGFEPYMSFIDFLFNLGADSAKDIMRKAGENSITHTPPPLPKVKEELLKEKSEEWAQNLTDNNL